MIKLITGGGMRWQEIIRLIIIHHKIGIRNYFSNCLKVFCLSSKERYEGKYKFCHPLAEKYLQSRVYGAIQTRGTCHRQNWIIHVQFQLWDMSQCALNKHRQVCKEALSFPSDYNSKIWNYETMMLKLLINDWSWIRMSLIISVEIF